MWDVVEGARAGDPAALGELWRQHQHLLLRYFRSKGMSEPEDLASTVWLEVASGLPRFQGDIDDFRRWLFTIAARRRIDEIRSAKRDHERFRRHALRDAPGGSPGAGEIAEREAALGRALELVRGLPPDQAEAVRLRVIADLSVTDVAMIMHRSEGSVRVLVHRGLKTLNIRSGVTTPGSQTMDAS
jgi:RNA polymerase sigma-70 factor (ECF subfamily)